MHDVVREFPIITVSSSDARQRGQIIGEEARSWVLESVSAYQETFGHFTGLPWERIKEIALEFKAPIEAYDPEILSEIEGIAEGAGLELGDTLALNARSEIMFGLNVPVPPECTAFYAGPEATADGHVLLGQNWDWRPRALDGVVLFEIDQGPDRPQIVTFPEAGIVGKAGFNQYGIGVTLNALISDRDVGSRDVPIHVILRGILNSRTFEEAFTAIVRMRRSASATYTIASAGGVGRAVEVGPGGVESVYIVRPTADVIGHANHFSIDMGFKDVGIERWSESPVRQEAIRSSLEARAGSLTSALIEEALRDETGAPDAICRFPNPADHPVDQLTTVASIIMDLSSRNVQYTVGPPRDGVYTAFTPKFA